MLSGFRPLSHLAPIIRHHHRRWSDLLEMGVELDTAEAANLIYLADRGHPGRAVLRRPYPAHPNPGDSRYTEEHSLGVSRLSGYLAGQLGLSPRLREMIEIAGLLHDLGKLQIPDEILESTDAPDEVEFGILKSHSYATYQALRRLGCTDEIAAWAGYHHECVNGSGYPFHKKGSALPVEARIINVADIFQALAQNRPYRSAMTPDDILSVLTDRVRRGLADARVVRVVAENLSECMSAAANGPRH